MAQVTITINSREYAVACEDGQEVSIIKLSRLLDEKAKLLTNGSQQVNENMLLAMVGLLLADELTELKKSINSGSTACNITTSEGYKESDINDIDKNLSSQLNILTEQIISLANQIKML